MKLGYIGIANNGDKITINKYPRKEICEYYGTTHAEKMFNDDKDGNAVLVGYIVKNIWVSVYEVHKWNNKSKNNLYKEMGVKK